MTLIVALNCKDGFVVASDTQVTEGPVKKLNHQKIFEISNSVLFASSGTVGAKQKYLEVFQRQRSKFNRPLTVEVRHSILRDLGNVVQASWKIWKMAHPESDLEESSKTGSGPAEADMLLLVKEPNGQRKIWHITGDCQDEISQERYVCSGTGSEFAHALLNKYDGKYAKIEKTEAHKAALIAYRVVRETIDVSSEGVGGPVDLWIMNEHGVKRLDPHGMSFLDQAYSELVKREAQILGEGNLAKLLRENISLPKKTKSRA